MTEAADQPALEYVQEASLFEATRFYLERVAYTRRGNFAFLVGMLYWVYDMASHAVTAGTPAATSPIYSPTPTVLGSFVSGLEAGVTVLVGLLSGVAVLLLLDVYESKVDLTVDPDH